MSEDIKLAFKIFDKTGNGKCGIEDFDRVLDNLVLDHEREDLKEII